MQTLKILKTYWGYDRFRDSQEKVIKSILNNQDVLALMATGSGKSLCYQLPALIKEGLTLVVSPLLALMREQTLELQKRNIPSAYVHSGQTQKEQEIMMDNLHYGGTKILYLSPERIQDKRFIERISSLNVGFIAVDEAHCISEWGHDFRPSYLQISQLRTLYPRVPLLALSASVTPEVSQEIMKKLYFRQNLLIQSSLDRKNLTYKIIRSENKWQDLLYYLSTSSKKALIYVQSRSIAENLAHKLSKEGFSSDYYHAGICFEEKKRKEKNWHSNSIFPLVATNAFGMGMNKPDVHLVLHWELPASIESYFQEAGRAGRNGVPAQAVLLYDPCEGVKKQNYMLQNSLSRKEYYKILECLYDYHHIGLGERPKKPLAFDLETFKKRYHQPERKILQFLKYFEQTLRALVIEKTKLQIRNKRKYLVKFEILKNLVQEKFLEHLLRKHPKSQYESVELSVETLLKEMNLSKRQLIEVLNVLKNQEYIEYTCQFMHISYLSARVDKNIEEQHWKNYQLIQRQKIKKFQELISYVEQQEQCRSISLLSYFGEKSATKCKNCDICLS